MEIQLYSTCDNVHLCTFRLILICVKCIVCWKKCAMFIYEIANFTSKVAAPTFSGLNQ